MITYTSHQETHLTQSKVTLSQSMVLTSPMLITGLHASANIMPLNVSTPTHHCQNRDKLNTLQSNRNGNERCWGVAYILPFD